MPIITNLEKRTKTKVDLYLDGLFCHTFSPYALARLKVGDILTTEEVENLIVEDDVERGKKYVLDYQLHQTLHVIEEKLTQKGYQPEAIKRILTFLTDYNIIDDHAYAERLMESAFTQKMKGKKWVEHEMAKRGVHEEVVASVLMKWDNERELETARTLLLKKGEAFREKRPKAYAYLANRGFSETVMENLFPFS